MPQLGDPLHIDLFKWQTGVQRKECGRYVSICLHPNRINVPETSNGPYSVCIYDGSSCRTCPEVIGMPPLPIEFDADPASSS